MAYRDDIIFAELDKEFGIETPRLKDEDIFADLDKEFGLQKPSIPEPVSKPAIEPGSIFKPEFMPQFQKEEPTTTEIAGTPYVTPKEVSPQYSKISSKIKLEKDPLKIAELLKNVPEPDREKLIQERPAGEHESIRQNIKLFEREHPEMGAAVKAIGAGVKEAAGVIYPSYDPYASKNFQRVFGSIKIGDEGKERFEPASADQLKSIADKYRDDTGLIDLSKAPKAEPRVKPFLEAVKRFEEHPEKQKKIKAAGEHIIGFGEYMDPFEIKEYRINERIEALKKDNPDYGAALERGSLKMAIEKAIGDYTISGDQEKADRFVELNKKYDEAVAMKPEEKRGLLKNILISSLEMAPPMVTGAAKGIVPVVGQVWSYSDWARQGTGMVTADLRKAGVSFETARKIAPLVGGVYAAVEFAQVGQITKLAKGVGADTIKKSIINTALKILKEKGADYLSEIGEEGIQQFVTDVGTDIGKKTEGLSEKTYGKILWDGLKNGVKATVQAAGPMAVYSFLGVGASMGKATTEQILKPVEAAPEIKPEELKPPEKKEIPAPAPAAAAVEDKEKLFAELDKEFGIEPAVKEVKEVEYAPEEKKVIIDSLKTSYKKTGLTDEDSEKISNKKLKEIPREVAQAIYNEATKKEEFKGRLYFDSTMGLKTRSWGEDNGYYIKPKGSNELKAVEDRPVFVVDIDHFKKVNDTFGHGVGDDVLHDMGELLRTQLDEQTLADSVRHGGEEIVIFPLQNKEKDVIIKLEEIRDKFKTLPFAEGNLTGLSFSVGHGQGFTEADKALYYAKETGRDKTVSFTDVPRDFDLSKKEKKKEELYGAQRAVSDKGIEPGRREGAPDQGYREEMGKLTEGKEAAGVAEKLSVMVGREAAEKNRTDLKSGAEAQTAAYENERLALDKKHDLAEIGSKLREDLASKIKGDQWKNLITTKSIGKEGRIEYTDEVRGILQGIADGWNLARSEGPGATSIPLPSDAILSSHKGEWTAEDVADIIAEGYNKEDFKKYQTEWKREKEALEDKYYDMFKMLGKEIEESGGEIGEEALRFEFEEEEKKPLPEEKKVEEKEKPAPEPKIEKKPVEKIEKPKEEKKPLKKGDTFTYKNRIYELKDIKYDSTLNGVDRYKFYFKDMSIKGMLTRVEMGSVSGMEKHFGVQIDKDALPEIPAVEKPVEKVEKPKEVEGKERGKEDEQRKKTHDREAMGAGKPETGKGIEEKRPVREKPEPSVEPYEQPSGRLGKERDVSERGGRGSLPGYVSTTGTGGERGARGDELSVAIPKSEKEDIRLIDYLIQESDRIGEGGSVKKTKDNLAAIRTLKQIEKDDRFATSEEQQILVHYVGWGGLSSVFKEGAEENKYHNELKELLTEEEYNSAKRSTLNAHYTSPTVIQAVWRALTRLGFNGGNVLEPAIGIGHFFGLRPAGIKMGMSGIELDSLSARIAKQLYQNAAIQSKGYQNVKMPADYYQVIISNVPFSEVSPVESNETKTPGVPKGAALHDFYFLKSLYGLQPGGLIAFVTTHYTMDKKDSSIRKAIAEQANFIGTIRLPSTAFKENAGTEVVTDVIFLQKREKNDPQSESNKDFIESIPVEMDKQKGEPGKKEVFVNRYFNDNPDMVIGTQNLTGTMYGANQYNVTLNPGIDKEAFKNLIDRAINNLPENIVNQFRDVKIPKKEDVKIELREVANVENMPWGSYFVDSGTVYQKDVNTGEVKKYEGNAATTLKSFVKIKEIMLKMFIEQRAENIEESKKYLAELNNEYDNFVKRFGALNSKFNDRLFKDDPSIYIVQSIEEYNEKKQVREKGAILKGALLHVEKVMEKSDSPLDALVVSLNMFGSINIDHIASMIGKTKEETTGMLLDSGLIFKSAEDYLNGGNEIYVSREEYLSGDVRQKLLNAKKALKKDKFFQSNVDALVVVQPLDIPFDKIGIKLNSPVLSTDDIGDFIKKLLETNNVKVLHNPITGQYTVTAYTGKFHLMNRDYGTERRDAVKIIKDILADVKSIVYDTVKDDNGNEKRVLNEKETAEAQVKNDLIKKEFSKWVWDDDERTKRLVRSFNDRFNAFVNRVYIHPLRIKDSKAVIKFINSAFPYAAREHQADAVWRIIQSMRVMLAHEVGSGKTLEMIWGAAELKRMGFVKKPMFVFPNHMVKQWTREYMQAYPTAKILVAQEGDLSKENRRRFINKIAAGDWDAVLIKMQDFLSIPLSPAEEMEQTRKIIKQYKTFLISIIPESGKKDRTVKELEKKIDKYENKIASLKNRVHKEKGTLYFDDLGVDMLLVDEADLFKNLEFFTTLKNVRGLGTQAGSGRAMDLFQKTQYLYKKNGRVVFATGTPISNTLVESYSLMRYLQPEWLHDQGIESFDDWQRLNAQIVTAMLPDNTGTSYKLKTFFANIQNARSLMKALRETWDIKTAKYLEDNGIMVSGRDLPYKKVINIAAPLTDYMKSFKKYLVKREDDLKGKKPGQKGEDNVLVIIDDGKKAALDMRLFSGTLPDIPESKLNIAVNKIVEIYKKYNKQKYTQIIFCDASKSYRRDAASGKRILSFDAIKDIVEKLKKGGIKESEIAVISDKKYEKSKAKADLFQDMRDGKVRVLIGSVAKMGAGTNVQDLGKAIHFLDAKWRPRDFWQAIGRFVRQGNNVRDFDEKGNDITKPGKKGTVEIYNYATRGSLDTGIWSMLETKARAIENVMGSTENVDYVIEEDFFSSVKELSIEDPAMKEAMNVRYELKEMETKEDVYIKNRAQLKSDIKNLPDKIAKFKESIKRVKQDIEKRTPELKGDDFKIIIGGVEYTKKTDAGEAIIKIMKDLSKTAKTEPQTAGDYAGFKLKVSGFLDHTGHVKGPILAVGNFSYGGEYREVSLQTPLQVINALNDGIYNRMDNLLRSFEKDLSETESSLEKAKKNIDVPFEYGKEIEVKKERLKELDKILEEQKERQAQEPDVLNIDWESIREVLPVDLSEGTVVDEEEDGGVGEEEGPEVIKAKGEPVKYTEETRDMFEGVLPPERTAAQIEIEERKKARKGGPADYTGLPIFEGGAGIVGGTEQLALFDKGEPVHFKQSLEELKGLISPALWDSFDVVISDKFGPGNKYSFGTTKEGRPITKGAVWKDVRGFHVVINPVMRGQDISSILVHEVMGHAGAINVLRSNKAVYKRISDLYRVAKRTDAMEKLREKYAEEIEENPKFAEDLIFGEWIAYSMEDYIANPKNRGIAYQVWRTIRQFLISIGLVEDTVEDVMYAIAKDIKTLKRIEPKLMMKPMMQKTEKEIAPAFYSPLQKAVSGLKQERGTGDQMFAMITKTPGVKEAEWKWMGLDDFLKGKQSVTKQEIEEFVRQNQVQVKEVHKNISNPRYGKDRLPEDIKKLVDDVNHDRIHYADFEKEMDKKGYTWIRDYDGTVYDVVGNKDAITKYGPAQMARMTLPGGENYREVLLTLSPEKPSFEEWAKKEGYHFNNTQEMENARREYTTLEKHGGPTKNVYRSSHWEEPNVIAHVRMDDRTGPNGEKVLFVEEIQSDWAREEREKGIAGKYIYTKEKPDDYDRKLVAYNRFRKEESDAGYNLHSTGEADNLLKELGITQKDFDDVGDYLGSRTGGDIGVPAQPFLKNWEELTLKRVLRMAAEEGYDRVAWINGEQTADRYDLSKQVEYINYLKGEGGYFVDVVGKDGHSIWSTANASIDEISKTVGKDIATKIEADKGELTAGGNKQLSGENLKIGGEWAKNLYDRMIPKFYEKYGKKWGVKIENIDLIRDEEDISSREMMESEGEAAEVLTQQSIPITESMRESVLYEGQPMFSKTGEISFVSREDQLNQIYAQTAERKAHPIKKYLGLEKSYRKIKDKVVADILTPISTRLKHINPVFKNEIRKFEHDYRQQEYRDLKAIEPFNEKYKNMKGDDQRILDIALKNSDKKMVSSMISKYGMEKEYDGVREVLDSIHARAKMTGFSMNYLKEYWPRLLLNHAGLINYVSESAEAGIIDTQIEKAQKSFGRPLTEKEKGDIIDRLIARPERIVQLPGGVKKRTVNVIDNEMDRFYDYSISALINYIHEMDQSIEIRKFLGMDIQSRMEEGEGFQEKLSFDNMVEDVINNRIADIEGGIDKYILKALEGGKLKAEQQDELIGILKARFNYRPSGNVVQTFKDLGYIGAMGSGFSSFLTQIGDFTWAYYTAGPINATKSIVKSIFGKSEIKKEHLGLNRIAEEFRTSRGLGRILQKIFDITLLTKMDNVGKEALINGLLAKYQRQAQSRDINLLRTLQDLFGYEVGKEVLEDLKNKRTTDNVKYMLFTRLLDFQPLTLTEMPLSYLKSPKGRVFYMLKTFTIKQLDAFRNESIDVIVDGFRKKDNGMIMRGFLNLGYLTALFIAANAGADELKDWLFGRRPSFEDKVWDNIFRLFGLSRYLTYEVRREGPVTAFWKLITPPMDIFEAPMRDAWKLFKEDAKPFDVKLKSAETWKLIPFFGKHYYWWFGGGREKELKHREKTISPEYVKFRDIASDAERKRRIFKELKESNPEKAKEYRQKNLSVLRLTETNKKTEGGRPTSTLNKIQAEIKNLKERREKALEAGNTDLVKDIDQRITDKSKRFLLYYKYHVKE